ncbi:MAG: hypothetical protein PHY34_03830 [Patescibacteria group bacterium]|nr:hypothetical protein [Patescibacteria group bacterium]
MVFSKKALAIKHELETRGLTVYTSQFTESYSKKTERQIESQTLYDKNHSDAIREFWKKIQASDAILVLNYNRNGIQNYVGGNVLMEIGFAHVLNKKIFLLNPIPEIPYYKSEISATNPTILHGNLDLIQ